MPLDGNLLPCTSSSRVVWDTLNDGAIDECTQTDERSFASLANSYSPPTHSNDIVADSSALFHTGVDIAAPSHPVADIDSGVTGVNGDGLSAFCYSLHTPGDVVGACAEDTQNVGLWKRFDNNAWQTEQDKLKQMSVDLPAESESESKDDQLPDLSSSNRLSVAALRLYDSIYGGQSTSAAHRVPPARSLSSLWMRDQSQYAAAADQPAASSVLKHSLGRGPCPAIHRAVEAERHVTGSEAYSHNVCESGAIADYQSSSYISQSQLAQQMSSAEHLPVTDEKCDTDSIPETFVATDDISAGLAAEVISRLGLSEREFLAGDSSHVDSYRWQTSAMPSTHGAHLDASMEDAVLARRPSIKELKSRFEAETSSSDVPLSEAARLPWTAARRHQFESASLRVGRRSFHGRTDHELGHRQRRKPSLDTAFTGVIASAAPSHPDNSAKNSASKGRFVTRSSVAANAVVNLPVLSTETNVDQAEHRQFERLVDRRKVFETADTQPVA